MEAPQQFGSFTLLRKLAEGGMAVTWLARVTGDEPGQEVVIKRVLPKLADSAELRALFMEETRVATTLDHPNLVHTWDVGDVEGEYYLAMEYVWGEDMRRIAERGSGAGKFLPLRFAAWTVAQAARGLDYFHARTDPQGRPLGLVHRDVSPPNIMLTYAGDVKVIDFGIAKAEGQYMNVRPGQLKGKFSYMSPEQVQGLEVDHRSDLFALGTLLYELTVQKRLFRADSDIATIKLVSEARYEAPHLVRPDYPPRLEEIVVRALARDPRDRYASGAQLASDLEQFLRENRIEPTREQIGAYLREIFPDRVTELQQLLGAGYAGPVRKPTLARRREPSAGHAAVLTPPTPEVPPPAAPNRAPAVPAPLPIPAPSGTPAAQTHAPPRAPSQTLQPRIPVSDPNSEDSERPRSAGTHGDDDSFTKQGDSSRPMLIGVGAIALLVVIVFAVRLMQGSGSSHIDQAMEGVDLGPHVDEFDAGPPPAPERPATTLLSVTSEPAGAAIVVNGIATGASTPAEVEVVQNALNTILLQHDGFVPLYQNVTATTSASPVTLTMEPIVQPPDWRPPQGDPGEDLPATWTPPRGRIRIETLNAGGELAGAQVLLNGAPQPGETPLEIGVPALVWNHVTVRMAEYQDSVAQVRAIEWNDETDTRVIRVEMTRARDAGTPYSTLRIDTTPDNATLFLDGEDQGRRDLINFPSLGHHVVRAEAPDHEPWEQAFDGLAGIIEVNAVLTPIRQGPGMVTIHAEPLETHIYAQVARHGTGANEIGVDLVEARELEAGMYTFTLGNRSGGGRQRATIDFEIKPGVHHQLTLRLENNVVTLVESSEEPMPPPEAVPPR